LTGAHTKEPSRFKGANDPTLELRTQRRAML
jgi:hypothetical protein